MLHLVYSFKINVITSKRRAGGGGAPAGVGVFIGEWGKGGTVSGWVQLGSCQPTGPGVHGLPVQPPPLGIRDDLGFPILGS